VYLRAAADDQEGLYLQLEKEELRLRLEEEELYLGSGTSGKLSGSGLLACFSFCSGV